MIRTIWLAAFCLAGLGGLCASKVTASIYPSEESVSDQSQTQTVVSNVVVSDVIVADTLTKTDTAEVAPEAEATGSLPVESNDVVADTHQASRSKHLSVSNARLKTVMLPRKRPKIRVARNAGQDDTATDPKNCSQTDGLGNFLKTLAGSPHCG
jgi:hypothetical protein